MTTNAVKKLLLGALSVVAIYIWYDNLLIFTGQSDVSAVSGSIDHPEDSDISSSEISSAPLEYIEPKINPFSEKEEIQPPPLEQQVAAKPKTNQKTTVPPKPSTQYRLIGSLEQGKTRVIALADGAGKQILLNRGDTLSGWRLRTVSKTIAVFAFNENRDTLSLPGISLP